MKKPILIVYLFALMVLGVVTNARAQESTTDRIVLSDLTYQSSSGLYYFEISLQGSRRYTAYNMDISFPEGINVALNGTNPRVTMIKIGGIYPSTFDELEETYTYTHTVSASKPDEGQLRIACSSSVNEEFTANSGKLLRVYVALDPTKITFSPKPIVKVTGINLTQSDATKYVPADFSCRPFTTGIPAARTLPINISSTNKVGTLILPFNAELPEGVQAYQYNSVDETKEEVVLEAASSFVSCKPYIVYAENGYSGNISGTVDLSAEYPDEDVYTDGGLTGVLTTTVVNTGYIMQNKGDGPQFYSADGANFSLPAGRCYMTIPASEIKAFSFNFDVEEGTTEISSLSNEEVSDVWYTLQGVKLDQKPTEKGVYFYGQQKVLIQ